MLSVAIIGATGVVGQEFIVALDKHPWFEVSAVAASERSAGKRYIDALRDNSTGILKWHQRAPIPEYAKEMVVKSVSEIDARDYDLVFTAVETDDARVIEPKLAGHTPVISTAAAFRYEQDVPILIPGVNDAHAELLEVQREKRGWNGFIAPLPNCTTTGLAITLKPIQDAFGIERVIMTSLQAVSGAGRSPGVSALDIFDNIIPFIPNEEEKVQIEARKILGKFTDGRIEDARFRISCTCTRVPVIDGHTECAFVETSRDCEPDDVKRAMLNYSRNVNIKDLPSAPEDYIIVYDDPSRPQPRLDRDVNDGMSTIVGRIRRDTALERGVKYVLLSHNEKMGSAKGAVLLAEMLKVKELF